MRCWSEPSTVSSLRKDESAPELQEQTAEKDAHVDALAERARVAPLLAPCTGRELRAGSNESQLVVKARPSGREERRAREEDAPRDRSALGAHDTCRARSGSAGSSTAERERNRTHFLHERSAFWMIFGGGRRGETGSSSCTMSLSSPAHAACCGRGYAEGMPMRWCGSVVEVRRLLTGEGRSDSSVPEFCRGGRCGGGTAEG